MTPEDMAKAAAVTDLGLQIASPSTARGTYRTRRTARNIDYFLLSGCLAEVLEEVRTVEGAGIKGHVLVEARFVPRATEQKNLVLRPPPKIPADRIYGALMPAPSYAKAERLAMEAVEAARGGASKAAKCRTLNATYAALANTLEKRSCATSRGAVSR